MPDDFGFIASVVGISRAARICGLTARAIRLYEERGLVSPHRERSGRRLYGPACLERLRFIAAARAIGLTLAEIRRLVLAPSDTLTDARGGATRQLVLAHYQQAIQRVRQIEAIAPLLNVQLSPDR